MSDDITLKRMPVFQHTMHIQMWTYMSNPQMVVEFFRKYAHDMRDTPLKYYKKYIYDRFFKDTKDIIDLSMSDYCFACYAANVERTGNNGCGFCPLFAVYNRCIDGGSTYRETEIYMEDLYTEYVKCELGIQGLSEQPEFMKLLTRFCNDCQAIAFQPLNRDMIGEYVVL